MSNTKKMQSDAIDFFRNEQSQEKISHWVYIFNILRYFLNSKNIFIVFIFCSIYFTGGFIKEQILKYQVSSAEETIKLEAQELSNLNTIFDQVLKSQESSDTISLVNSAEKEILALFNEKVTILKSKYKEHSNLHQTLNTSKSRYSSITEDIAKDKQMFAIILDSAKMKNAQINNLKYKDIQKYYQRLEFYKSKNYATLFGDEYLETANDVIYMKQ